MSLVEQLFHDYGDFKLEIPRWEIADEGVTVLWGPSGAGKTSVFRHLIGLEQSPRFKWTFDGVDLAKLSVPQRRLGVVFQSLDLFPHLSARENILFAARARGLKDTEIRDGMSRLVSSLRMEGFLDRKASLLSGGEKQRTALARALVGKPRFLLLDEPFSALDEELRDDARKLVQEVIRAAGVPALLITHDQRDVAMLGTQVYKIRDGRLEA